MSGKGFSRSQINSKYRFLGEEGDMNMGWVFAVICILLMFWSVEMRFKELYNKISELKDISERSIDKAADIQKQLDDWKKFLK